MREEITLEKALELLEDYHTNNIDIVTVHLLTQYPNKVMLETGREDGLVLLQAGKSSDGVVSLMDDRSTINFREDQCFLVNLNKFEWRGSELLLYVDVIGDKNEGN